MAHLGSLSGSMEQEEIADPEGYCMLKIEKIEAAHNCLRQGIASGHLKAERAEELKNKFEDLREALHKKIMTQRKLVAERSELVRERQQQEKKLEKMKKEAVRDEETIAIIGEDAEEADAEAQMAIERCEKALLEAEELKNLKQSYLYRIEEIKREHVIALEPVIARLKQEIQTEEEECKERVKKLDQSVKEIEDTKAIHARLLEGIPILEEEKLETENKLKELAGKPEKLRKQVDIMHNAVKAMRVMVEKWNVKADECEKQRHGVKTTIKQKKEEHAHAVANFHKFQVQEQEQEIVTKDLFKKLETAKSEMEVHFNDQVYLDLQLMGKLLDLKHLQELHTKAIRERERVLIQHQQVQQELEALQTSVPVYKHEKETAYKKLVAAEEERAKWEAVVNQVRKDVDLTLQSLRAAEKLEEDVLLQVKQCNAEVLELDKELIKCIQEDHRIESVKSNLKRQSDRLQRLASLKYTLWKQMLKKVETEKGYHKVFVKRVEQLKKEYEDNILLYNDIRSQRNRILHAVEESGITMAEMNDELAPLGAQVENLRNDVTYKLKVFDKIHQQVLDSMQACEIVKADISKCTTEVAQKKFTIQELKVEKRRVEEFIQQVAKTQKKMRKDYTIHIQIRNNCGLSLIDRNDELSILYEKINVQVDLLKFSEVERNKRMDEIALLRRACNRTYQDIALKKRNAQDPTPLFEEFKSLQKQVSTAKSMLEQLSELCESPCKETKQCRHLKGFDLKGIDLERKAWAIQVFINKKENQVTEKDIIFEELAALLKSAMRQGALKMVKGTDLSRKMNETVRQQMTSCRALVATISELALVQARAMSLKREKEEAFDQLHEAQLRLAAGEGIQYELAMEVQLGSSFQLGNSKQLQSGDARLFRPPTEEAARELAYMEREAEVARKIEANRQAQQLEEQKYQEAQHCSHTLRPKTTPNITSRAEKRPNAYRGGPFELPVPFPVHLPFRPSTQGNSLVRHARKPSSSPAPAGRSVLVAIKS